MSKKGFSLVELLGVITVLAIILIIALPKMLQVIDSSSKKAFTSDVSELVNTSKLEYNEKLESNKQDIWYYFQDGEQVNYIESEELHFNGNKPSRGYILMTKEGEIELELVSSNEKWCASKELEDKEPVIDTCEVKEKEPITFNVGTSNTTKSITITVSPSDLDIYYYKFNDGKYESSNSNVKIYEPLDANNTYKITVKGCRKKQTVCEEKTVTVKLPNLEKPRYNIENVPSDQTASNGWAISRKVTIDYSQEKNTQTDYSTLINQYIYADTQEKLIEKISNNNWNVCETNVCTLPVFTSDAYIISRITDGYNVLTSSVQQLTNFDTEKPTTPVITGGSSSWTTTNRTISVSTLSTAKSGIKKYQYYMSTSSSELIGGSWKDCKTSTTSQIMVTNGEYYVFFKAISYVGLESDVSNYQVVKIDSQIPTAPVITGGDSINWKKYNQIIWITTPSTSVSGIKKYQYCEMLANISSGCTWKDLYNNNAGVSDSTLDVAYYHSAYSDLANALTGNVTSLSDHYVNAGKSEGRSASDLNWFRTAQNISTTGTRYIFFRAINNVDTAGTPSQPQVTRIMKSVCTLYKEGKCGTTYSYDYYYAMNSCNEEDSQVMDSWCGGGQTWGSTSGQICCKDMSSKKENISYCRKESFGCETWEWKEE